MATWAADTVFMRTRSGDEEIVVRARGISGDLRNLLLLANGRRNLATLATFVPALAGSTALLDYLVDEGLIAAVGAPAVAESPAPPPAVAPAPSREPAIRAAATSRMAAEPAPRAPAPPARAPVVPAYAPAPAAPVGMAPPEFRNARLAAFKGELAAHVTTVLGPDAAPILPKIDELSDLDQGRRLVERLAEMIKLYSGQREGARLLERFASWS